jgi:hypothetical protein
LNAGANTLTTGSYSDSINFTNVTNGTGNTTRTMSLTVIQANPVLSVTPANGLSSTGTTGGSFVPSSVVYTLSNTGNAPMNWTAGKSQSWLTLSSTAGTLASGTSTTLTVSINSGANSLTSGSYSDTVTLSNASNGNGNTTRTVSLNVAPPPPSITSSLSQTGTNGSALNYQVTATNSPTSYDATSLPAGLSLNTATGLISGTPTLNGTFNSTIRAVNTSGTGSATLVFNILQPPPAITSSLTATGTNGFAFSYQITATNSPTGYGAINLPTGLIVSNSTGLITGTPTQTGTFNSTISAVNSTGTGAATLVLAVAPPPDTTAPVLVVTTPDQTTTSQAAITLQGTASDASGILSVTANGIAATTGDNFAHWSATVGSLSVGINTLTVIATDSATPANTTSVMRSVLYYTGSSSLFDDGLPDAWKIAHGLDPFSNTGSNSATGNPSGDGIPNLMKYALNLDPQQNGSAGLPFITTALNSSDSQAYLIFNYRRIIGGGGLTYIVESSSDLAGWTSTGSDLEEISSTPDADGVTEDVQVRVHPSLGTPGAGSKFIRLRVTAP